MKTLLLPLLIALICFSCSTKQSKLTTTTIQVEAPFKMPAVTIPDFTNCKKFLITDFGALKGDKDKTSAAIAAAIDEANKAGGGIVVIPEGEWLTGQLHFKSNVNLHLEKGAVLLFNDDPKDYLPPVHTSWEGLECYNYSPLVYAYECKNVAITGEGELKAKMDFWRTWFPRPSGHMNSLKRLYTMMVDDVPVEERVMVNDTANLRPHFIQFNRSENILLDGVKITNSPFWTIHPYLCKNVVLRNLHVYAHGHNNDGVDPEMTQNMLIENCEFDQGDDAIAVKSGRNQDAWRLNTPTKNLVIRNCYVRNGHQLLAVGSEMSGGVENVYMDSCTVADGASMFHLVFLKTNERRGGFIRSIYVSNVKGDKMREGVFGIETDVLYQWRDLVPTVERRLTPISDIHLENVHANNAKFISRILGQKELPVENIFLTNVVADTIREQPYIHENVINFRAE
ncbi:glycoside hydrolase family 28 protein [Mangrovibacterium diazotrophicum]|uniref:Glycosyl hydrolase family 28 n=1 Tax=Mangrovibacterium diazotrophicum TaxID=1261403 RepID=A0A419W6A4_9BACT|nr:glycoside hydrolase family 28 protein [Mangrovibacterium diazotrophicum]RKD90912.1 glycosyl hydrolase family 28 [Mangrovibacterium diazotrophicum]